MVMAGLRTVGPAAPPLPGGEAVAVPLAALAAALLASLLVGLYLSRAMPGGSLPARARSVLPAASEAHRRLVGRIAAPAPTRAIRRAGRNRPAVSAPAP